MPLWKPLFLLFTFTAPLLAQGPAALPASPVVAPDLSRGFDLLFDLGLPDVSGPEWQYVPLDGALHLAPFDPFGPGAHGLGVGSLPDVFLHGWVKMPSSPPPPGDFPPGTLLVVNGWQLEGVAGPGNGLIWLQRNGITPATMKPGRGTSDEKRDAAVLGQRLQELAQDDDTSRAAALGDSYFIASCFFRAALHHRRGHREEAAAMVRALLAIVPRQDRLIDLAVSKLAETRHASAMDRFSVTGDWRVLHADLTFILRTYTRGWDQRPFVEKLHAAVTRRLAAPASPPVPRASLLTPEQQAWWQKVADSLPAPVAEPPTSSGSGPETAKKEDHGTGEARGMGPLFETTPAHAGTLLAGAASAWLYDARMKVNPSNLASRRRDAPGAPAWVQDVLEKDWDWITVAAAALEDDTLVPTSVWSGNPGYTAFDFESDPPELDESRAALLWQEFNRPHTRGELAALLLGGVLPVSEGPGGRDELPTNPAELLQTALETARALQGRSSTDVARYYLQSLDLLQKRQALLALINSGTPADLKVVEDTFNEAPGMYLEEAAHLARTKGTASRPVIERLVNAYLVSMKTDPGSEAPPDKADLHINFRSQVDALEHLAAGRGLAELIADYAGGRLSLWSFTLQIKAMMEPEAEPDRLVEPLLQAALQLPKGEAEIKMGLLSLCADFGKGLTPGRKDLLLQLLQKDSGTPVVTGDGEVMPLSHIVYQAAARLSLGSRVSDINDLFSGLGKSESWPLWANLGRAVLEDTPLPPLPSAAAVPAARRQEMIEALNQRLEKGWPEYVQALSLDDKLALDEELSKVEDRTGWLAPSLRLIQIDSDPPELAAQAGLPSLLGQSVSASTLVRLGEICRDMQATLKEDQGIRISVTALALHRGMRLLISRVTLKEGVYDGPTTFANVAQGMRRLRRHHPQSATVNGYSWMWWFQNAYEVDSTTWHLDKDHRWQSWPPAGLEEHDTSLINGSPVAVEDLIPVLEARINHWSGQLKGTWFETGTMHPPPLQRPPPRSP